MKKIILLHLILSPISIFSQVGINTNTPLTALHVAATNINNPLPTDGIIIPKVKSLNGTDNKTVGLLVFLDNEDQNTLEIEKGFYWWDGTTWIPFFSMNKITEDFTITYVSSLNNFKEGNITSDLTTNIRTIEFDPDTLIANDEDNFMVNANKELVIKKKGYYHVQAVISIKSTTTSTPQARDSFEAKILINNLEPSPNLRTSYGFPNGGTSFDSNSVISGYIKVNANDRVSININRYYHKENSIVTMTPNGNLTNLTLRYMGDY